jgi:hypothetical protein
LSRFSEYFWKTVVCVFVNITNLAMPVQLVSWLGRTFHHPLQSTPLHFPPPNYSLSNIKWQSRLMTEILNSITKIIFILFNRISFTSSPSLISPPYLISLLFCIQEILHFCRSFDCNFFLKLSLLTISPTHTALSFHEIQDVAFIHYMNIIHFVIRSELRLEENDEIKDSLIHEINNEKFEEKKVISVLSTSLSVLNNTPKFPDHNSISNLLLKSLFCECFAYLSYLSISLTFFQRLNDVSTITALSATLIKETVQGLIDKAKSVGFEQYSSFDEKDENSVEDILGNENKERVFHLAVINDESPLKIIEEQMSCIMQLSSYSSTSFTQKCLFYPPPSSLKLSTSTLKQIMFRLPSSISINDVKNKKIEPELIARVNDLDVYNNILKCVLHSLIRVPLNWVFLFLFCCNINKDFQI